LRFDPVLNYNLEKKQKVLFTPKRNQLRGNQGDVLADYPEADVPGAGSINLAD